MTDLTLCAVGRATACLDRLRLPSAKPAPSAEAGKDLDRTGLLVDAAERLKVSKAADGLVFAEYESLAHTFWRAQELTLLERAKPLLQGPVLDFGCGDGSFAAVLFDRLGFGVDKDRQALDLAEGYGLYENLVEAQERAIPLADGAAGSVFSNSVLEHVVDLDPVLRELRRVTAPGGRFVLTVPIRGFHRHLSRYFGTAMADRTNEAYFHRNLLEPEDWRRRLEAAGFKVVEARGYQPPSFTYLYIMLRLLGRRGLGRFMPSAPERVKDRWGEDLKARIRASVQGVPDPANLYVVAEAA